MLGFLITGISKYTQLHLSKLQINKNPYPNLVPPNTTKDEKIPALDQEVLI